MSHPGAAGPGNAEQQTTAVADLGALAAALKGLHHVLLEEQRHQYEREEGPIQGGAHLLHLVAHDAHFAWLRSLSALMVDLDALLDEAQPPVLAETGAIRQELDEMFSARAPPPFWEKCAPLLQIPAVVMAYAPVRAVLARLPGPVDPADVARQLHERHRWAVARRKRGLP